MDERLPARKERRHRQKSHVLTVDDSVYHLWRGLASREGLNTDSAVATFLLKRYGAESRKPVAESESVTQCLTCHASLSLVCLACRRNYTSPSCSLPPPPAFVATGEFSVAPLSQETPASAPKTQLSKEVIASVSWSPGEVITDEGACLGDAADKAAPTQIDRLATGTTDSHNGSGAIADQTSAAINRKSGGFQCTQCGAVFSASNEQTQHQLTCCGRAATNCSQCHMQFTQASDLKAHTCSTSSHTGAVLKPHVCRVCGQAYTAACNLTIHMRKHSGQRPYLCQECGATFTSPSHLQGHMQRHRGYKPYQCEQCHASFSKLYDLKVHRRRHSGEKPFQCELCGKAFSTSSSLARHVQGHRGSKQYKCQECPAAFSHASTLKIHRRRHTGDLLKCETCGKGFLQRRSLVVHVRTHTGEKPFPCPHCSAAFRNANSLKQHLPVHTGLKPHHCPHCGKSFALASKLARHVQRHETGKPYVTKPYSCHLCSSAFTQPATLVTHLHRKHCVVVRERDIAGVMSSAQGGSRVAVLTGKTV